MLEREDDYRRRGQYWEGYGEKSIQSHVEIEYDIVIEALSRINKKKCRNRFRNSKGNPYKTLKLCNEIYQLILKYPGVDKKQLIKYYICTTEEYPF